MSEPSLEYDIIEFLDSGPIEAVEVVEEGETILELHLVEEISTVETSIPESMELLDVGPSPLAPATMLYIIHDGVEYAPRSTVTNDPTRPVIWMGPVQPAIDATYALDNVDVFWNTGA